MHIIRKFRTAMPRWLAVLVTAALGFTGVAAVSAAPAAAASAVTASGVTAPGVTAPGVTASGVVVQVGYADNARANPNNFPTPWAGSPGVTFAGCTGCTYDAGAVRVVNNTPIAQTVDSVIVKVSTCTFDIWPHGTVLQPGQQLIVTQTNPTAAAVCGGTSGAFDTSDIGVDGAATTCTPDGVIPEVDVSIDGATSALLDSQQVLNTGGIDLASCPSGTNESAQWSLIGTRCPSALLTLGPATQTDDVGTTATFQATLTNSCGTPLQGVSVTFTVQSGPDAGLTETATTDANGVATFSYTGSSPGTDIAIETTANPAGTITSNTVTVIWQKRPSSLTITGTPASDYHDPGTVSAVLTDNGGPAAGQTIVFTLNGIESCSAVTDASGTASCQITPQEAAGSYPLTATFSGSATDLGSSSSATYTVDLEQTTLTYTGPTKAANGVPLTLSGVLREDGVSAIAGRTVTFTLGSGASAQSCTGTTDGNGNASCTISSVNQPASTSSVPVTAVFAGDAFYLPASAGATLKFQYMTGRAYGLSSSGLVAISPIPDTGPIQTASAGTFGPPCVASIGGLISADTLCALVVTSVDPGTSTTTSSVQDATIGVPGVPVIKIGLVQSSSTTNCSGSTGSVTIGSVSVGGIPVNVNLHPGANTTVTVLGVTLTFNEQTPVAGADQGLTVNAVHINALGLLNVVIGSSTSDIHNC